MRRGAGDAAAIVDGEVTDHDAREHIRAMVDRLVAWLS